MSTLETQAPTKPVTEVKVIENPWDLQMIPNHFRINGTLYAESKWKAFAEIVSKDKTLFPGCKVTSSCFYGEGVVAATAKTNTGREIWVRRGSGYHTTVAESQVKKVLPTTRFDDVRLWRRDGNWDITRRGQTYPMSYSTSLYDLRVSLVKARDIAAGDRVDVVSGVLKNGLVIAKHGPALWVLWPGMSEPSTYTADRLKFSESANV